MRAARLYQLAEPSSPVVGFSMSLTRARNSATLKTSMMGLTGSINAEPEIYRSGQ